MGLSSPVLQLGERWDSNPQQRDPQSRALPVELRSPCSRLAGLEPATHNLEGCCSIHLSYRRQFGMVRLELTTSWSQTMRANQLRYIPFVKAQKNLSLIKSKVKQKLAPPIVRVHREYVFDISHCIPLEAWGFLPSLNQKRFFSKLELRQVDAGKTPCTCYDP